MKLLVAPGLFASQLGERRPRLRARASMPTRGAVPTVPPCLRWRAQQARLTQVSQQIRTLERATAPPGAERPTGAPADRFLYAAVVGIARVLTRRQRAAERPVLLERLAALHAEAQCLDRMILRERIASAAIPEAIQLEALLDPQRPTSYFVPQLARFFAAQNLSDTGVAEAYLASLELLACDCYLSGIKDGKAFEGVRFATIQKQAREAARVCDVQLDLLATQGDALYDLCTLHAEALKRWRRHFNF